MEINITDSKTIAQLKSEFSKLFPHLKLKFYTIPHSKMSGTSDVFLLDENLTVGIARTKHNTGELSLSGKTTVKNLEEALESKFGLHAQVFRKSGKVWLQTTKTDEWTLAHQEENAKEMELR